MCSPQKVNTLDNCNPMTAPSSLTDSELYRLHLPHQRLIKKGSILQRALHQNQMGCSDT